MVENSEAKSTLLVSTEKLHGLLIALKITHLGWGRGWELAKILHSSHTTRASQIEGAELACCEAEVPENGLRQCAGAPLTLRARHVNHGQPRYVQLISQSSVSRFVVVLNRHRNCHVVMDLNKGYQGCSMTTQ